MIKRKLFPNYHYMYEVSVSEVAMYKPGHSILNGLAAAFADHWLPVGWIPG
jgi:hypothetical protein